MALAEAAGVEVSPWRLDLVLKRPVLMARRFDPSAFDHEDLKAVT